MPDFCLNPAGACASPGMKSEGIGLRDHGIGRAKVGEVAADPGPNQSLGFLACPTQNAGARGAS